MSGDSLVQKQRADQAEPRFSGINGGGMKGIECISTEQGTCTHSLSSRGELHSNIILLVFPMFTYSVFSVHPQPRSWALPPPPEPSSPAPRCPPQPNASCALCLPFSLAQCWPPAPSGPAPSLEPPRGSPFSLVVWSPQMWARGGVRLPSHNQRRPSLTAVLPDPA